MLVERENFLALCIRGSPTHLLPSNQQSIAPGRTFSHMEEFLLCSEKDIMWEVNNSAQHSLIRHEPWKATMFQIMTYSHERYQRPFLFRWNQSFIRCIEKCFILYGLIIGICQRTPTVDIAAHMVVFVPL